MNLTNYFDSGAAIKIESGNQLVNESGDTMEKVVNSIKRVNDIMAEIAAASAEQASGRTAGMF